MARRPWFADRTTGDLLVILIAVTVCTAVLSFTVLIGILTLTQPDRDTSAAGAAVTDVVNTLIGLLAGFLAGRTDAHMTIERLGMSGATTRIEAGRQAGEVDDAPARSGDV